MLVVVLFPLWTTGGEQEKNEMYLSTAMGIVNTLGPERVPKVTENGGGGSSLHATLV